MNDFPALYRFQTDTEALLFSVLAQIVRNRADSTDPDIAHADMVLRRLDSEWVKRMHNDRTEQ